MLIRLWILGITAAVVVCELIGDNICEFEESYPVNVTEYSLKNATVRNYKWCMGFPPRCSFYTFKTVRIPRIVEKNETRLVKRCCPGFAENLNSDRCVPCMKCIEGTCGQEGKCICSSGFHGKDCAQGCDPTRWGSDCKFECLCEHGSCDPRSGRCDCPAGWFGTRCELLCLEGFFGKHCVNRCSCGERDLCSPETGKCLKKSTHRQEHQSTRAIHYMTEDILNITKMFDKHRSTPSLKKYHTFDMELSSVKPFHLETIDGKSDAVTTRKNDRTLNTQYSTKNFKATTPRFTKTTILLASQSSKGRPKLVHNSAENKRRMKNARVRNMTIFEEKYDSTESTTEMSAEIRPYEDNLPILNEDGSLEKKDSNQNSYEVVEKMTFSGNVSKIINSGAQSDIIDRKISEVNNSVISSKEKESSYSKGKEPKKIISPSNQNRFLENKKTSVITEKETDFDMNLNKKISTNRKNSPETKSSKIPSKQSNFKEKHRGNKTKIIIPNEDMAVEKTTRKYFSKNDSEEKIVYENRQNISLRQLNPSKTSPISISIRNDSNEDYPKRDFSERKNRKLINNQKSQTLPDYSTSISTNSFTEKTSDIDIESDGRAKIPPFLKSTTAISRIGEYNGDKNLIMEEDRLQNLDALNILTSKEPTTPTFSSITPMESSTSRKEGILPVTETILSTKSSYDDMRNDLSTSESTEDRKPLKEAFDSPRSKDDIYLSDETSGEFEYSTTDSSNLANHMTIAALISFILVIIMSAIILIHHFSRKKRKRESKLKVENHQNYPGGPTVSVYTHSIFHTPLPDPPTFENPVFTTPTENSIEHPTFQTHVVCSLNFPGHHHSDEKEYTYDHPPSTGSYRAASIPEPPDINEPVIAEPVYDEIPSNGRLNTSMSPPPSYKSSCIYVNTCGKTRF